MLHNSGTAKYENRLSLGIMIEINIDKMKKPTRYSVKYIRESNIYLVK